MGKVVVFGSANTDLVLRVDELPQPGATVLGQQFFQAAGGKGANQAVAAARAARRECATSGNLVHSVVFVSAVGNDAYGQRTRDELARESIELHHLRVVPDLPSGVALIMVDCQGHNMIGVAPGANERVDQDFVASLPDALFQESRVVLAQLEIPIPAVQAALRRGRAAGAITLLNPAPPDPRVVESGLLADVDLLVLNEHEAAVLGGQVTQPHDDWGAVADRFHQWGVSSVVITLGRDGFFLSTADQRYAEVGLPVEAVDTVAAGDTFVGVMACRLAEGAGVREAACWGNVAAAISVTRPGAQPSIPHRYEIEAMLSRLGHK